MRILYLSTLISPNTFEEVQQKNPAFTNYAVHKFNRLVVEGFVKNGVEVCSLSSFYLSNRYVWSHVRERNSKATYRYIPSLNLPLIRHLWLLVYTFFHVLFWGLKNRKEKAVVCDVLTISACLGAVLASKINGVRNVGIMTDMPGLMVDLDTKSLYLRIASAVNRWYLAKFDCYVFLTAQMNVVNKKQRPFIVMEGLVDSEAAQHVKCGKASPRTIVYAGMLHARYGVQMLVDAVKMLPLQDIQLVLYGGGPMVESLQAEKDPRICYRGLAPNDVIIEAEQQATLLVNPRPTHEEFTKYSFPSKNMEYMLSGTPLLTTKLPGMPSEYYPYVYLFKEETTEGYAQTLQKILSLPSDEISHRGLSARDFVMENKSNTLQAYRILQLLNKIG